MDNYIGRLLDDRYEILEEIGSGGMAVVYKARCNRLNRLVAVKVLKDDLLQDTEFRRRFHAESQAVAMMSHPNIVSVYDVAHGEDMDYIVMELIEGLTLKQYMEQKGQLNWRETLHFSTQIAKALEHAHSRGIIHRDIKPQNIMILKDGSVKVADFGIAQVSSDQHTLTREALGSVHYISPEQAKGAHVDYRSDLYSLGVVMYEMLVGRPPFDGDTPVSVAIQHINATPVPPHLLNSAIPEGLEQITMHAMTADLDKRYASASEMLEDLEEFRKNPNQVFDARPAAAGVQTHHPASGHPDKESEEPNGKPVSADKTQKPAESRRGSRVAVIAGVICIILALLGIGYFLYSYFFSDLFARTEEQVVPGFLGEYYEDIRRENYPDFNIEITQWVESSEYEYGYVIGQKPEAGRTAKVGSTIELTVSKGVPGNEMPNLVNMSLKDAQNLLDSLNISVSVFAEYEESDLYTDGYVIRTVPEYGAELQNGDEVTLVVSRGSSVDLIEVPPLVGKDVEEALKEIDEAGLGRGSTLSVESELPEGTVTFQSVEAGQMVKDGTVINLQISRGPVQAAEPIILSNSVDCHARVNDSVLLRVRAAASDDGVLSYTWYESTTGDTSNGTVVQRESENGGTFDVDTSNPGTYYYYCKVTNSLEESTASACSNLIEVVVEEDKKSEPLSLMVPKPADSGTYSLEVCVDGISQIGPMDVDMSDYSGEEFPVIVSGSGVQSVEVYINGDLYKDWPSVDFDVAG